MGVGGITCQCACARLPAALRSVVGHRSDMLRFSCIQELVSDALQAASSPGRDGELKSYTKSFGRKIGSPWRVAGFYAPEAAVIGFPIWALGGLTFGFSMWFFLGRTARRVHRSGRNTAARPMDGPGRGDQSSCDGRD
jgi:hypothetical protein